MPWEDTQGNPLDYNQKQCIKSHEKTSLFNLFCISFRTYPSFDKILIYNALLLFTHDSYDR